MGQKYSGSREKKLIGELENRHLMERGENRRYLT